MSILAGPDQMIISRASSPVLGLEKVLKKYSWI
jgi:hypothetical protein